MALGATASEIQSAVLGRGLAIAGIGATAGVIGAIFLNRGVSSLLYGVSATDIKTLIGVVVTLAVIALLATLAPARWGGRVDPASALRSDG
jgi:ABC-type lipoprotein release transport system permease subunit